MTAAGPGRAAADPGVRLAVISSRAGRPGMATPGGGPGGVRRCQSCRAGSGGQVVAQQHRGRRGARRRWRAARPPRPRARGHRHRGTDSGRPGDQAGGRERQRARRGGAQVRAGRERRLVGGGTAGGLVLGQGQGERGGGQDHQQERPALPDRAPGDLPAGQRDGEPPAPGRGPLGQPGHGREQAQHEHGHGGQRERGRDARPPGRCRARRRPGARQPSRCAAATRPAPPAASSARSAPARAAPASAACRPRRTRAAPGAAGRTAGQSTIAAANASTASAAHHADAGIPETPDRPSGTG